MDAGGNTPIGLKGKDERPAVGEEEEGDDEYEDEEDGDEDWGYEDEDE